MIEILATAERTGQLLGMNAIRLAQNIVDTVPDPLLILDDALRVRAANRAFYLTFNVSSNETEGRLVYELGDGQWNIPLLRKLLEEIIPTDSTFNDYEIDHDFPIIGRKVMLLNGRKLRSGNHSNLLLLMLEDVTERHRVHDHEVRCALELQATIRKLQDLEKARNDLTQMIIHDLRTPLTSVIAGVHTLDQVGELNHDQRSIVEIALAAGELLLRLINNLLDVEEAGSKPMELEYSLLSVQDLIKSSIGQVDYLVNAAQLTLENEDSSGLPALPGDLNKLQRVLVNLLGNAIKFTPAKGKVTIGATLQDAEQQIVFFVSDTGEGISLEDVGNIFDKFYQVPSRRRGRLLGNGLGLAFCKLVVEAHGGSIFVQSSREAGSRFSFSVPLVRRPQPEAEHLAYAGAP